MAKLNYLNSEIRISVNSDPAKNAFQSLLTAAEGLRKKLDEMRASGIKEEDLEIYNKMVNDLNLLEGTVKKTIRQVVNIDEVINNLSGTSMTKLQQAAKKLRKDIDNLAESDVEELTRKLTQLTSIENQMKKLGEGIAAQKQAIDMANNALGEFSEQEQPLTAVEKEILRIKEAMDAVRANMAAGAIGESSLEQLQDAAKGLREELNKMPTGSVIDGNDTLEEFKLVEAQIKETSNALKGIPKPLSEAEREAEELRIEEEKTAQEAEKLKQILANIKGSSFDDLQKAARTLRNELNGMSQDELKSNKDKVHQLKEVEEQLEEINKSYKRQESTIKSVAKRLAAYVGIYGVFNALKNSITSIVKKNIEFSDQLADIQKTTGLSAKNVEELSNAINKIDTRSSREELHGLAFEAGRLGIGGGGADAVLGFVRAADQLKVALGEDLGEEAILQLAKMGDVMGTSKKMGVEKALLATGSAINELSQSSTASGKFIADYARRLSGIATQAHLTTAELLAFGAASDATGQELEVSATAMNRFVVQLQTHYKTVAKAAGVNEEALHEMLTMGETADAVVMVLEALSKKGGLSMLAPLMKDLGSDGARLTAALSTLASNIGIVKDQLDIARSSFEENISVTTEYNVKNENAAAIMAKMKSSWEAMFVNAANTGVVKQLAQELFDFSKSLQSNGVFFSMLNGSLVLLVETFKLLVEMLPVLAGAFTFKGLLALPKIIKTSVNPALISLKLAFQNTTHATVGGSVAMTRFALAFRGLTNALKSNVFILLASAIGALALRIARAKTELSDMEKDFRSLNESVAKFEHNSSAAAIESDFLFNKLKKAKSGTKEYKDLMTEINKQYGKYLPSLITEQTSLAELAKAHEIVNGKLRQSLALKAKNAALDEIGVETMKKLADERSDIQEVFNKYGLQTMGRSLTSSIQAKAQEDYSKRTSAAAAKDQWTEGWGSQFQKELYPAILALRKQGATAKDQDEIVRSLEAFYDIYYRQQNQVLSISKKYDPIIKGFTEPEENGAPYQIVQNEKEEEKVAGKRESKELKWARDQYKAVMSAIEVYYRQQEQVINQMTEEGKITNTERELRLEQLKNQQLGTQVAARSYLHGDKGAEGKWYAELGRMDAEKLSQSADTEAAMANLWDKDLKKTGDFLRKFGEATDDAIWKNLETDKVKMQESAIEQQEEVRQILLKGDYTGLVTEQYLEAFQKLGFFSSQITDKFGNVVKNYTRDELKGQMTELNGLYDELFNIDIKTPEGLLTFRQNLQQLGLESKMSATAMQESLGKVNWAEIGFGEGTEAVGQIMAFREALNYTDEELELLYEQLLEYGDAMAEAERKARQAGQRVADERWRQSGGLANEKNLEGRGEAIKDSTSLFSRVGLASENVANDMEIQLYTERMNAALAYRDLVIESGGDIEKANEKVQESIANLSEALVEKTMTQLETLKSFMDPLETLGEEMGAAFAIEDATERTDAFREAMWNAADDVAQATKEMITNWVKQKIQHAINKKAIEAQEAMSQSTTTTIVQTGEQAKAMAVQQSETQISTTKATKAAENITTEATETSTSGALNIAKGSAKTIGELGWWGIPLVAVISALIGGLISWAMGKVKGAGKVATDTAPAATGKVVSGMLAYDSGNVQSVLGSDGNTYAARVGGLGSGSGIVTAPTLTNVGGQAALVGELGPEVVIGRATTRAMMQDNPRLLHSLVQFDRLHSGRGFRTYDSGNLTDFGGVDGSEGKSTGNAELINAISELNRQLSRGIHANVVRKELVSNVVDGMYEEKTRGNNKNLTRLLG